MFFGTMLNLLNSVDSFCQVLRIKMSGSVQAFLMEVAPRDEDDGWGKQMWAMYGFDVDTLDMLPVVRVHNHN